MTRLSRRISPTTLFMLSMNGIIGSGWLFAPLYAAKIAGSAAIISWVIGGFAAILIALTFAELSTMLPVAGGTAHVPQLSHGGFVSFIMSWLGWLTSLMLAPIEVQAVLQYAALFFPHLMHYTNGVATLTIVGYLWAAILMLLLCIINVFSYRILMRFNFVLFIFKIVVMLLTIFTIFHIRFNPHNFSGLSNSLASSTGWQAILSAVATGGIALAFNGFKSGVEMAGEAKKLWLAIPLSTAGTVFTCLLIYLGLQICFIGALTPAALQQGWHALTFTGDLGPFVGLAAVLGLVWLLKLLYINSIVSPLGAGLIYVTSTARVLYAMSRIGYMPRFLSHLNRQHLPVWAIVINFLLGMLSFLPLPGWQAMVNFLISAIVITYAMGPLALISLRYSMPAQTRPFRLPCASVLCFIAFYICNLFSYWTGWATISKLACMLAVGILLFMIAYWRGNTKIKAAELKSFYWVIPYLSGLVLISYLGAFGGKNIISFGWDFLIVGVFSLIIYQLAILTRLVHDSDKIDAYLSTESAVI